LFGFSRGAYTARKLGTLIDALGLLNTVDLGYFFQYWSMLVKGEKVQKPGRDTKIKCVGVWDTVGSIFRVVDALHIKDDELPASIVTALQAVSLQDNRYSFWPTLWVPPASGLASGQTLKEVWFPGAHCDVGGGYEKHELADLPLFWMADQLTYPLVNKDGQDVAAIVDLDLDFIWRCRQQTSDSWGNSQPHNAWKDLPAGWPKTRVDLCQSDFLYHESIKYAPTALDESFCMITLQDLITKFSTKQSTWQPTCPSLGTFETKCKNDWDTPNDSEVTFENTLELFDPVIWVTSDLVIPSTEMIQNGMTVSNVSMCVARVAYEGGIHPGKANPSLPQAWFGYGGNEYSVTTDYEVLVGSEKYVRWVSVSNELQLSKLNGAVPVIGGNESDQTVLYIARYNGQGGKVRMNSKATYTYGGKECTATTYDVLVYNDLGEWTPTIDSYWTDNSSSTQINSESVSITQMTYPPCVAVGLNKLDMSMDENLRVIAYADGISTTELTVHINAWSDTTLYNAGVSWLTLASNDPEYQCGSWSLNCDPSNYNATSKSILPRTIVQRVNFNVGFASQPKVFVGISGMDLKGDWYLQVSATDIDAYGFTVHVLTAANTTLYGIKVDWVAYLPTKYSIWNGVFTYQGDSHVDFGVHFLNPPTIFTALTQFDISNGYNLRVYLAADNVTNTGMDVSINKWSDTVFRSVTGAYLAIDKVAGP
jgi:hypothetical protein